MCGQLARGVAMANLSVKPDDLGDPHLDEPNIGSRGHGKLPQPPALAYLSELS
jgi:hypothetical protein